MTFGACDVTVPSLVRIDPAVRQKIKEVILAAPDIDADVFKRDIAPALAGTGANVTPVTLLARPGAKLFQAVSSVSASWRHG